MTQSNNILIRIKLLLIEIRNFYSFFWNTSKSNKEIVFFSEDQSYYPYMEGIIKKLITKYKLNLCYITSSHKDNILNQVNPRIKTFYINKLLALFMQIVDSRVFVMTLTSLDQLYIKRSKYPVHYVYVFHGLVSTHMVSSD